MKRRTVKAPAKRRTAGPSPGGPASPPRDNRDTLRALERKVLDICANEQYRIGRDLHDTFGQELMGMSLLAKSIRKRLNGALPDVAKEMACLEEWIEDAVKQARRIARGLSPVDKSPEGLAAALRHLGTIARKVFGVKCRCLIRKPAGVYDHGTATHLYHIAQEALNNAVRHAQPSQVQIALSTGKRNRLTVRNDGRPLPEVVDETAGLGIRIMRYRARVCGGSVSLRRTPSGKTALTVPFENPRPEPGAGAKT
jgi:signal transduction histidine kinase